MDDPWERAVFTPSLTYRDPAAALEWLERVFGLERVMVIRSAEGAVEHAEMRFQGRGGFMFGPEWSDFSASPAAVGGRNTQRVHVMLREGLDAHCERVRAAGAEILMKPKDQFYGDRSYLVRDLEGHVWTFSQPVRKVGRAEAEAASGLKIEGWLDD
jgi:uncharacterized glyoxalase superfamily protein PhnB